MVPSVTPKVWYEVYEPCLCWKDTVRAASRHPFALPQVADAQRLTLTWTKASLPP